MSAYDSATGQARWRRLLNPFDLVVIAGGTINLVIVVLLFGYWLLHG
ncbi:MAG: hypothetical protein BMS9Abin14_867 [Gammaproteobacteria bacterium]|nr:MAG: hypothetical protein BMS9Abin14_867 [Gammaproteobacteria bacterium]